MTPLTPAKAAADQAQMDTAAGPTNRWEQEVWIGMHVGQLLRSQRTNSLDGNVDYRSSSLSTLSYFFN